MDENIGAIGENICERGSGARSGELGSPRSSVFVESSGGLGRTTSMPYSRTPQSTDRALGIQKSYAAKLSPAGGIQIESPEKSQRSQREAERHSDLAEHLRGGEGRKHRRERQQRSGAVVQTLGGFQSYDRSGVFVEFSGGLGHLKSREEPERPRVRNQRKCESQLVCRTSFESGVEVNGTKSLLLGFADDACPEEDPLDILDDSKGTSRLTGVIPKFERETARKIWLATDVLRGGLRGGGGPGRASCFSGATQGINAAIPPLLRINCEIFQGCNLSRTLVLLG
ncbi:hypothetical protein PUN28_004478 [Cardiocondyla obscurior]|uniref:Uncharacterized protein n=1 Tax=Cardiocondyla obscurior TaxID=286306 RepID=A0AAW2GDQ8_9HYME